MDRDDNRPVGPSLVVFCDTPFWAAPHFDWRDRVMTWIHARLKPGFRHCFVLRPAPDGTWLVLDPMTDGLNILTWPAMEEGRVLAEVVRRHGTAIWANPVRLGAVWGFGPITCVTAVKAHLGLRAKAITPYQLYLHLAKEN